MIIIAMLGSISFVLMQFNFPLPALPAFLKVDFSDIPALIGNHTMGPIAGIAVELFKNILDWFFSGSPTGVPVVICKLCNWFIIYLAIYLYFQ